MPGKLDRTDLFHDIGTKGVRELARLLRLPGLPPHGQPHADWLASQKSMVENEIPSVLKRPFFLVWMDKLEMLLVPAFHKNGLPIGRLCASHSRLDPTLIGWVVALLQFEISNRIDRYRRYLNEVALVSAGARGSRATCFDLRGQFRVDDEVEKMVREHIERLSGIASLYMSPDEFCAYYGNNIGSQHRFTCPIKCPACMLSVIGGRADLLIALRANLRARNGKKTPRLLRLIEVWIDNYDRVEKCGGKFANEARRHSDALLDKLNMVRRVLAEKKRLKYQKEWAEREERRQYYAKTGQKKPKPVVEEKQPQVDADKDTSGKDANGRGIKMLKGVPLPRVVLVFDSRFQSSASLRAFGSLDPRPASSTYSRSYKARTISQDTVDSDKPPVPTIHWSNVYSLAQEPRFTSNGSSSSWEGIQQPGQHYYDGPQFSIGANGTIGREYDLDPQQALHYLEADEALHDEHEDEADASEDEDNLYIPARANWQKLREEPAAAETPRRDGSSVYSRSSSSHSRDGGDGRYSVRSNDSWTSEVSAVSSTASRASVSTVASTIRPGHRGGATPSLGTVPEENSEYSYYGDQSESDVTVRGRSRGDGSYRERHQDRDSSHYGSSRPRSSGSGTHRSEATRRDKGKQREHRDDDPIRAALNDRRRQGLGGRPESRDKPSDTTRNTHWSDFYPKRIR